MMAYSSKNDPELIKYRSGGAGSPVRLPENQEINDMVTDSLKQRFRSSNLEQANMGNYLKGNMKLVDQRKDEEEAK